jgi:hypothetical protein
MIRNIPELQEANRSEVVVEEIEIATLQIFVVALFATHVAMQFTPRFFGKENGWSINF